MQLKPIDQQVVVVFGASSGIGRETALRFAQRGAKVVVAARSAQGLDSLVHDIRRMDCEAIAVPADAADFEQVKAVADRAVAEYGRLDTWVHAAAVSLYAPFEQTKPEEFKRIVDINLIGQAYGAMAALPHLKREGRGALIHISSVEARRSLPYQSAYAASKHGIEGFLDALRLELKHQGSSISVTNVMPASINTPLFSKARTRLGVKPMGVPPIYEPGVVADLILHAAAHPTRELVAGGTGRALILAQKIAPQLVDAYLLRRGFESQRTTEPKSEDAPSNLFKPIEGYDTTEGDFGDQARGSANNWFEQRPIIKWGSIAAAVGAVALLTARAVRSSR
ncbi:MAG: SDR family oxidoreductase [Gemmatimonadaceae bacterium]|nr:SDR family oxidoreductase [Gloeobacterales cyanobacterium ES-bin-141]